MSGRVLAPAGTVVPAHEVLGWLWDAATRGDERAALATAFESRYGLRRAFLVSSARAGMSVLLRAMGERVPGRGEVAMPGYTCYSVAASAIRAGYRVRPLDVDPATLDLAPDALTAAPLDRALALVATSLYGLPADLPALEAVARVAGAQLVDDAAQCLHGRIGDRWVGTFGDAGLFSFDKGKNLTSIQGGVIATRDGDLAERLARACAALPEPPARETLMLSAKMLAYVLLLRPSLYGVATRMTTLGETPFELEAPTTRFPRRLVSLVRRQFGRIDRITAERQQRADRLRALLRDVPGVHIPGRTGTSAVYPRLAIVFDDPGRRDAVRTRLVAQGIGATGSYPRALIDVPGIGSHLAEGTADTPRARAVAAGILTLPTHAWVTDADVDRISRIVGSSA